MRIALVMTQDFPAADEIPTHTRPGSQVCGFCPITVCFTLTREGKHMKRITLATAAAAFAAFTISAGAATTGSQANTSNIQQGCPVAPAVANAYLRVQAGKLTMPRGAVIAEITKDTGADGEFAGLKPCDSGYLNAVRFYIDEVIKAGTNNSTP